MASTVKDGILTKAGPYGRLKLRYDIDRNPDLYYNLKVRYKEKKWSLDIIW